MGKRVRTAIDICKISSHSSITPGPLWGLERQLNTCSQRFYDTKSPIHFILTYDNVISVAVTQWQNAQRTAFINQSQEKQPKSIIIASKQTNPVALEIKRTPA